MRSILVVLACLGLALPGWADGEACDSGVTFDRGPAKSCILLCNGASSTGACNAGIGIASPSRYTGAGMVLEVSKAPSATTNLAVSIFWASTSAGTFKHRIVILNTSNDWGAVIQEGIHFPGFLFATVDNTGTSTDIDVSVHFK